MTRRARRIFPSSQKIRSAELGANWDRNFGPVELNLVGLQRLERDQNFGAAIAANSTQIFNSVSDTGESILRATARYVPEKDLMIESGLEGAYNFLNGHSSFVSNGAAIALPGANPKVNEKRGEAFAQASWRLSPEWSVEAGARFEFSTIAAQGIPSRSFDFLKPRLLVSWAPIPNTQIRVRAERVVGQLDFTNFIASSNFSQRGHQRRQSDAAPRPALAVRRRFRISFLGQGRAGPELYARGHHRSGGLYSRSAAGWTGRATSPRPPTISMTWRCRCRWTGWGLKERPSSLRWCGKTRPWPIR